MRTINALDSMTNDNNNNYECTFTVFTPTYNRANLLPQVYEDLKAQTFTDFEWVIVDDGSSDGTGNPCKKWINEGVFPIRYIWQPNSGKHTAVNQGVKEAKGYFFAILDSDDWYVLQALEPFLHHWNSIPPEERYGFVGVAGLCAYPTGEIIGTPFPKDTLISDSINIRIKYSIKGDHIGINKTEIMRKFSFPENLGRFVTESLVWNRIAQRYKQPYVNEILGYKEYQPEWLSVRSITIRAKSPNIARCYYKEFVFMRRRLPIPVLMKNYANYIRFSLHDRAPLKEQLTDLPSGFLWATMLPLGIALFLCDRWFIHKERRALK